MPKKPITYGRQYIDEEDIEAVVSVLRSDYLTQGPRVREFEERFAKYVGAKYAVSFSNGTSALHGAYFAIGLKPQDEIITTPITFAATSNAALYLGAKPVFSDIESDTGNIDPEKIEEKISPNTKLIVPVHYGGHPVDMEKIYNIAKKYNLYVIEDACHALGAEYKGKKIGTLDYSDMAVFSFHPVKHITTGEGGMVVTNKENLYKKLSLFKQHGITKKEFIHPSPGPWYYEMQYLGYNYRLTDIQSVLGMSQLKKIDRFVEKRRQIVKWYRELLEKSPYLEIPPEKEYAFSSWHLYPVRLKKDFSPYKKEIFEKLNDHGIYPQVHYIPVYWHPYYESLGYKKGLCPEAEEFYKKEISLPIYYTLTREDVLYVVDTLNQILGEFV